MNREKLLKAYLKRSISLSTLIDLCKINNYVLTIYPSGKVEVEKDE